MPNTLSPSALRTINDYLSLPFRGAGNVRCPYFNNARRGRRGQLSVLVGKGSPRDIAEEAQIISLQYHKQLFDHEGCCLHHRQSGAPPGGGGEQHGAGEEVARDIRKFLIDNGLGVDCSGFVTRVLAQHFLETKNVNLLKRLRVVSPARFWRWLVAKLRPMENISVSTYASDENTEKVKLENARAGDVIVMLRTGQRRDRNHILIITETDGGFIRYGCARAWGCEGKYGHGVSEGFIRLVNPKAGLLGQEWVELGKTGEANETFLEAKQAKTLEIRRLKF
ncbi:hypothetical protein EPN28_04650 [Patescibacteria group bacterium]|nr:MAG: hypothetical protein EPN28_04650 [Patescibacteria group bacterium]